MFAHSRSCCRTFPADGGRRCASVFVYLHHRKVGSNPELPSGQQARVSSRGCDSLHTSRYITVYHTTVWLVYTQQHRKVSKVLTLVCYRAIMGSGGGVTGLYSLSFAGNECRNQEPHGRRNHAASTNYTLQTMSTNVKSRVQ